jgi:hypothetical protein
VVLRASQSREGAIMQYLVSMLLHLQPRPTSFKFLQLNLWSGQSTPHMQKYMDQIYLHPSNIMML